MKKLFFAICAVAALASCTTNEIVNLDREAIAFDGVFVDNATKAADNFTVTKDTLEEFAVWATTQRPAQNGVAQPVVPILAKETVAEDNAGNWNYAEANTQYWIPGNTYQFVALKNYGSVELANGIPAEITYDAENQADLLYASDTRTGEASGNEAVSFTFAHLLAKAYFTVETDGMSGKNANYAYVIKDVKINDAVKENTCDITTATPAWATTAISTYDVEFGHVNAGEKLAADKTYTSDYARLLVPAEYTALNITFTIDTLYGDAVIDSRNYNQSIAYTFANNFQYNFVLELGDPGEPIQFTVTAVDGWTDAAAGIPTI